MKTHILCLGDSNTHGYCADPKDNADGGIRFNENERWTCWATSTSSPKKVCPAGPPFLWTPSTSPWTL